ncbi:hypothetical protein ACFXJ8_30510 [Nonomuraea sp. NPDC059194]|uniref:hypothetical protein n=1 Tax=Nonomuraea sp. NPDC059194 TaxID=3346764 RepID=UPI0036CA5E30
MTGRNDTVREPTDDEHQRFVRYLRELAVVGQEDEVGLVRRVLRDPDEVMAQSAVGCHLDRRATQLLTDAGFPGWADAMATVVGEKEFLIRRLHEWILMRSIAMGGPLTAEELVAASDWFQRTAAQMLTSRAALGLLASKGRTRRVRATASLRLAKQHQ